MTDIRKQIATLPDDAILQAAIGPTLQISIKAADLKALADSHTRLLEAAKAVEDDMQGANTELDTRVEFSRAIEEAEKL